MVGDILQPTHLLFILVVALLVLGPKRLPEVGKALGNGLRDFRDAMSGENRDRHEEISSPTNFASSPPEQPRFEEPAAAPASAPAAVPASAPAAAPASAPAAVPASEPAAVPASEPAAVPPAAQEPAPPPSHGTG